MEKGKAGEVFNIGNDDERTILEFAKIIKQLTGSKSKIIFKPLPTDDPRQRKPDIKKAQRILGWNPEMPFEKGIELTINYFKSAI
jgi:dTDP-glucose 4,6-dehydratase